MTAPQRHDSSNVTHLPQTVAPPLPPARIDPWLDAATVAHELGVSTMTVYRLVELGQLRHTRVGRVIRIRRSWLDTFLRDHTDGGAW